MQKSTSQEDLCTKVIPSLHPISSKNRDLYDFIAEARNYSIVFWLLLPGYSASLKRIDYPKQICLAHPLSFECFYCSKGTHFYNFLSSPEPLGSHGELIVYPLSRRASVWVRPSTISEIFFSETPWPIDAKFYVEPPWEGGTKVYINGPGHMTKTAATPIYGKNLLKSSPEPEVL